MSDPTLKLVVAWSGRRNICTIVADSLRALAGDSEVKTIGDDACVVSTPLTTSGLRDALRSQVAEDEGLLVVEFETWSGYGSLVDGVWLRRRGH
jgi:hypothetical protein